MRSNPFALENALLLDMVVRLFISPSCTSDEQPEKTPYGMLCKLFISPILSSVSHPLNA